jgi:hypothetical protein
MLLAICLGPEALIIPLLVLLLLAGGVFALLLFAVTALVKWAQARRDRKDAEDSSEPLPAAAPGSV